MIQIGALTLFLISVKLVPAFAANSVNVTIEIIKASKTEAGFMGSTERYKPQISRLGFLGAKPVDRVTAQGRTVGGSVELQFRDSNAGAIRKIRVRVIESSAQHTKLHIDIPHYRFSTHTTHKNGGTFLVFVAKDNLFLAVRPLAH